MTNENPLSVSLNRSMLDDLTPFELEKVAAFVQALKDSRPKEQCEIIDFQDIKK